MKEKGWGDVSVKKVLILLLAAVMVIMVSGCGGAKPAPAEPAPAEAPAAETPAAAEETDSSGLFQLMESSVDYMAKGVSYDYVMTAGGETIRTHYAFKNGMVRFEGGAAGAENIMITRDDGIYMINLAEKTGFKMPKPEGADTGTDGTGDLKPEETMDRDAVKIIGSEDVNGEPCHVLTTKDTVAGYDMKMWVHKKYGIMMRMEAETAEGQMKIEITNLKVGDVADSEFEIPADVQMMEMPVVPQS